MKKNQTNQNNKVKELIKNTFVIFMGKVSTQFISFLLLPLYTSYIITSEYGYIDLITTYISLFTIIIIVQLDMAAFRFLIDCRDDEHEKKKVISNIFLCTIILTVVFLIIYFCVNIIIEVKYMWIILFIIISSIFSNILLQIARGLGKNIDYSISSTMGGIVTVILNIVLIVCFRLGGLGLLLSMLISNLTISLYLVLKLKILSMINFKYKDKKTIKALFKYSAPLVPNQISLWIVSISDRTIISIFLGITENGIYSIANKFPSILNSIYNIFYLSWSEQASLHFDDDDRDNYFSLIINNGIKIFGAVCLLIITGLPIVFNILINPNYAESYYQIPILLLGVLCSLIVGLIGVVYVAKKMSKELAKTSVIAAIINVLVNLIFIKNLGLYAASLSTFVAYLVVMIYRWVDIKKYIHITLEKKNIFILIISLGIAIYIYYINIFIINIISILISMLVVIYINRHTIYEIFISTKKYMCRKQIRN